MDHRSRFRLQALLLVVLLFGWNVADTYLASNRWVQIFTRGPSLTDLASLGDSTLPSPSGGRVVPGIQGGIRVNFARGALESDGWYLVRIMAGEGPEFALQVLDRTTQKTTRTIKLPPRAKSQEYSITLGPGDLPASNRLQLWRQEPREFELQDLQIHRLLPAWSWIRPGFFLLGLLLLVLFSWFHRQRLVDYFGASESPKFPRQLVIWDSLTAIVFALTCFNVFFSAPVQQLIDEQFTTVVSHRLLTAHTLSIPQNFSRAQGEKLPYQIQRVDRKLYHLYPDAVAVLNVPFVAAYQLIGVSPLGPDGEFWRGNELRILRFAAAFQAAVLCALLFCLARVFLSPALALGLGGVFAFGTQVFSTLSRAYWSHTWAAVLMAAAALLILAPKISRHRVALILSASLLSWSFFCRPQMAVSIVAVTIFLILAKKRHLAPFIVAGCVWALLFVLYSMFLFDAPLPPYFQSGDVRENVLSISGPETNYLSSLLGALTSANRGLFVYVPIFALVATLSIRYWGRLPNRILAGTSFVVILIHWHLLSVNAVWLGGQSFGPRLFSDVLVWFYLLAIMVVSSLRQVSKESSASWKAALLFFSGLLVAASIFINFRGATERATLQRKYAFQSNWKEPQFLAGFLPEQRKKTLEDRFEELIVNPDSAARNLLLQEILDSNSTNVRNLQNGQIRAVGLSPDGWTRGSKPSGLIVTNNDTLTSIQRIRLAVNAKSEEYPIRVFIEDGEKAETLLFERKGGREIKLSPVPPTSSKLFFIWSEKAWSPGSKDPRLLGVRIMASIRSEVHTD